MTESISAYDLLAPYYRAYADLRKYYIEGVDRIILDNLRGKAESLLDIGAGDGFRAWKLAREANIRRLVVAEPSKVMSELCRRYNGAEVWQVAAENLPPNIGTFDAITCLWNVLGHIPSREQRVQALRNMRLLLADQGQLFIDINNRYNARSYGYIKTAARALYDLAHPSDSNGDVEFTWDLEGQQIRTTGHVFRSSEVEKLIAEAGLTIKARYVVDYETGEKQRSILHGQLVYLAGPLPPCVDARTK
jgi:SAM-dependent methyltransferase